MTDTIFVIMLLLIAARVAYGLARQQVMWSWIVLYWFTLTVKNFESVLVNLL